jgi:hypothetical protein
MMVMNERTNERTPLCQQTRKTTIPQRRTHKKVPHHHHHRRGSFSKAETPTVVHVIEVEMMVIAEQALPGVPIRTHGRRSAARIEISKLHPSSSSSSSWEEGFLGI